MHFAGLRIRITQMRYLVSCHFCRVADSHHLNAYADPHQRFFVTATTALMRICFTDYVF
jgi:hypothetical protein